MILLTSRNPTHNFDFNYFILILTTLVAIEKSLTSRGDGLFLQDPYSAGGRTFDMSSSSRNLRGAIQPDTGVSYQRFHILEQEIALKFLKKRYRFK